jgi:hypothetical protein
MAVGPIGKEKKRQGNAEWGFNESKKARPVGLEPTIA